MWAGRAAWHVTLATLWRRSSVWRLFALLAPFLTLLFVLFPPEGRPPSAAGSPAAYDHATYVPQPAPPRAATASQQSAPAPAAATTPPRTAQLSLATAAPASPPNGTGLVDAIIGPVYTGTIRVDGFTVPLPPGNWVVLATAKTWTLTATGSGYYLGRVENKRLTGLVRLMGLHSQSQPGAGFPEMKNCTQPPEQRIGIVIDGTPVPAEHQACWFISNYYAAGLQYWGDRGKKMPTLERMAAGDLAAKGVTYPQDMVEVTFMVSDRSACLEAMYAFNPEMEGIKSGQALTLWESDWTGPHIGRFPEKLAYVAKLKDWGTSFWPEIKTAFAKASESKGP